MDFLNLSFEQITGVIKAGFKNLRLVIAALTSFFLVVEIVFTGINLAFKKEKVEQELLGKILQVFIWSAALLIFPYLMEYVVTIFTKIGLIAGGSSSGFYGDDGSPKPATLLYRGVNFAQPLYDAATSQGWQKFHQAFFYWMCWFIMMGCYVLMTCQFFLTYIEYYVLMGIGGVFLSFGFFKQTRFLSEKFLGSVLAHGTKILLFNFMVAAIGHILTLIDNELTDKMSLDYILASITTAIIFFIIVRYIPQMATGILSGTPTMSSPTFGGLLAGLAAIGATAMAAKTGARVMGRAGQLGLKASIVGGGGIGKALSAGRTAGRNMALTASNVGTVVSPMQQVSTGLKAAGKSVLGSLGTTMKDAGKGMFHRTLYGKEYKNMPQFQKPDSLKNTASVREYLSKRWAAGKGIGDKTATSAINRQLGYNSTAGMSPVGQLPGPEYFEGEQ